MPITALRVTLPSSPAIWLALSPSFQQPMVSEDWGTDWATRYQKSPDYEFLQTEGTKSLERGAAARGKQLSGAEDKALVKFGQNLARLTQAH